MTQEIWDENPFYKNWFELIQPKRLELNKKSHTEKYGKFECQPFERGFAITVGNSLRRVLLSSIRGAAITSIKIEGALHEFTAIDGILEDVAEIILNLKLVRLKLTSAEDSLGRIDKKGPGEITAGDIFGNNIEIMNPDQLICTVTGENAFSAELEIKWGKGYSPAEKNIHDEQSVGVIPIDAIFSPIKRIQYLVSQARVGQHTDYDKLTIEISTDGSISPENALAYAAKILKEQMTIFINFDEENAEPEIDESATEENESWPPFLDKNVEDLELSVRSANCLKNAQICYIGQLVQRTDAEMLKTKNFGRKSLNEIKLLLSEHELTLGMPIDGWIAPDTLDEKREG